MRILNLFFGVYVNDAHATLGDKQTESLLSTGVVLGGKAKDFFVRKFYGEQGKFAYV